MSEQLSTLFRNISNYCKFSEEERVYLNIIHQNIKHIDN